jgi:flagellar biosynthesis protein FliR
MEFKKINNKSLKEILSQYTTWLTFVGLLFVLSVLTQGSILKWNSVRNLLIAESVRSFAALGVGMIIITWGIDLSIGYVVCLTASVAASFAQNPAYTSAIYAGHSFPLIVPILAALVVGGPAVAASMGLRMANMIAPNLGNVPTLSQFFLIIGTLLFLSVGGHLMILSLIFSSFELIPIASGGFNTDMILALMTWSSQIFISAVLIAFPMMIGLLLVNALLGLVSRAAPSLNVFAIGFPALIPMGLIMLLLSMGMWFEQVENLWFRGFNSVNEILRAG